MFAEVLELSLTHALKASVSSIWIVRYRWQLSGKKLFLLDFCEFSSLATTEDTSDVRKCSCPTRTCFRVSRTISTSRPPFKVRGQVHRCRQVNQHQLRMNPNIKHHYRPTAEFLCNNHVFQSDNRSESSKRICNQHVFSNDGSNHDHSDHHSLLISAEPGVSIHIAASPRSLGPAALPKRFNAVQTNQNQGREKPTD